MAGGVIALWLFFLLTDRLRMAFGIQRLFIQFIWNREEFMKWKEKRDKQFIPEWTAETKEEGEGAKPI